WFYCHILSQEPKIRHRYLLESNPFIFTTPHYYTVKIVFSPIISIYRFMRGCPTKDLGFGTHITHPYVGQKLIAGKHTPALRRELFDCQVFYPTKASHVVAAINYQCLFLVRMDAYCTA